MAETRNSKQFIWRDPLHFMACGFGSGLLKYAPGTWGTVMAIPFYFLINHLGWFSYGLFMVIATLGGIAICARTAKALQQEDPPAVVWDEMVGFWLALWCVPTGWLWLIVAFVLFRCFDILKPWPISWMNRNLKGGTGIMLDDIAAGFFTLITVQVIYFIL